MSTPTAEQQAKEAMQRLSYFINRSAGQHRRAVALQFAAARENMAREANPQTTFTPWSSQP